ncbi:hypothetical protein [uncultured Nocardioides sp.]|uniref:hypothetical protein n=1 Tax=uncultured Nocardioides sp. TaxID=198441 RepID=UPI00260A6793|nr:hypothetical protein [uncultured Nocardioides sp.]
MHPLNDIVRRLARFNDNEVPLTAAAGVINPRAISPAHYEADPTRAHGHHVLIIDDTWTGGGHVTSAAMAVRAAGATHVSVLALARWLSNGWEATTPKWASDHLKAPDFDPDICPWTRGVCP